jgi:flagellar M-ring protein FliF
LASLASQMVSRTQAIWGRLGPSQRWLVAGLGVALAMAVGLASFLNRPEWVVLVSQVEPRDAAEVVARLQDLKVPYRPSGDGNTILIRKADRYVARLALDQAGLPQGTSVGMELFDEPKFGATEFDRKVNHLRAQQGELERALTRIGDVEYANVKLAIPERSVFIREQQAVTASVLIQPVPGRRLSQEQVLGIITFVSSSVQGLTPENVKVVDQTGRLLSTFALDGGVVSENDQLERQLQVQRDLEHKAQSLVEAIFGAGNVVARVSLQLDMDSTRTESSLIGEAVPKRTESLRESTGASAGQQVPPVGDPTAPPIYQGQGATSVGESWRSQSATDYEFSQTKEVTVRAPGAVKNVSVGVAINREVLSVEQIRQIQETVARATGAEVAAVSVVAMPFTRETVPDLMTARQPFETRNLAVGLGLAAALMLLLFLISRMRRPAPEYEMEMAFAGVPTSRPEVGARVDVALGQEQMASEDLFDSLPYTEEAAIAAEAPAGPLQPPSPEPSSPRASAGRADEMTPEQLAIETVRKRLASAMVSKGTRQIELDVQTIDPILMAHVTDLIDTSPEASAEMIRQWLKGGSDTWTKQPKR